MSIRPAASNQWWRLPGLTINDGRRILGLPPTRDPLKDERWECFVVDQATGNLLGNHLCTFLGWETNYSGHPRPLWSSLTLTPGGGRSVIPIRKQGDPVTSENWYLMNGTTSNGFYNPYQWNSVTVGTYPTPPTPPTVYKAEFGAPVPVEAAAKRDDDLAWLRRRVSEISWKPR